MPQVSGKEVLRFIKINQLGLKTIMLTGSPLDIIGLESTESRDYLFKEADYVMSKPFDVGQLLAKIKELIKM